MTLLVQHQDSMHLPKIVKIERRSTQQATIFSIHIQELYLRMQDKE